MPITRCCIALPLLFCAFVANISFTLYLFSPNSAKVFIQFPNTLVALAFNNILSQLSEKKLLGGFLSKWNIQGVSVRYS